MQMEFSIMKCRIKGKKYICNGKGRTKIKNQEELEHDTISHC